LGFEPQVKSASKNDRAEDAYHDEHLSWCIPTSKCQQIMQSIDINTFLCVCPNKERVLRFWPSLVQRQGSINVHVRVTCFAYRIMRGGACTHAAERSKLALLASSLGLNNLKTHFYCGHMITRGMTRTQEPTAYTYSKCRM
jgi:hypothetical protein